MPGGPGTGRGIPGSEGKRSYSVVNIHVTLGYINSYTYPIHLHIMYKLYKIKCDWICKKAPFHIHFGTL